jgi:putative transposase
MPWTETEPMKERMRFVAEAERGLYSMSELCARYGISRRTGYKWLERYEADGPAGLTERSRAPHHCPHRIDSGMTTAIVEARRQHPSWDRASSWRGSRSGGRGRTGRPPGRSGTCSKAGDWFRHVAAGGTGSIRALRRW